MNTGSHTNSATPSPVGEGWGGVVGVYGGSFNPIHLGHTQLGEWLCREGYVDELWFVVSPLNPLKRDVEQTLMPDELRLRLAELAVRDKPSLHTCDLEMHLPRPSYMVRTLETLRRQHPEREFVLIIGADNWPIFHQWKDYEEILRHHRLVIYPRPGVPIDSATLPSTVCLAEGAPQFNISSTEIRRAIAQGSLCGTAFNGQWLDPAVWQELRQYRKSLS